MSHSRVERRYEPKDLNRAWFPVREAPLKYVLGGREGVVRGGRPLWT